MADFNQKISTIREDLDALLGTVRSVETELHGASESFAELASNAKNIGGLTTAIQKLSKFLDGDKSPFLDKIKERVKSINDELSNLNVSQLQTATAALAANAKAMSAISRAQANTNRNIAEAKTLIESVRGELAALDKQSETSGNGLEGSIERIEKALGRINHLTNVSTVVGSLNEIQPEKYKQAADALDRIAATVRVLKQANISIDLSAASEGQKLSKKPIQPVVKDTVVEIPTAPTGARTAPQARPRTVQFAQERGVDLNNVQGTGARGLVTKEDVLTHIQANAPAINAAAAAAKSVELRNTLEKRISNLNKLDNALAAIETAKDKAFQLAANAHGLKTSYARDIARKHLIPTDNASPGETYNRRRDFEEIRKNKSFDDLGVGFERQLREITIETDLPNGLDSFKANDTKIIDKIKSLRKGVNAEAERLAKEIAQSTPGPSFALSHVFNTLLGRQDTSNPAQVAIDERAKARVRTDTATGAFYTKGNGKLGATQDEAAASLAAIDKAVETSPHKIAVVTTVGTNVGSASAIPGAGPADHVLLFFKDLDGKLRALEHLGDEKNLAPGNKTGSVTGGAYAPERRSPEEIVSGADSVKALPLLIGTAEQAKKLIDSQTRLTTPGKSVYSFANELSHSDLVAIGDTCATATAESFKESGILTTIEQNSKFANVPGTTGANLLTPEEVLRSVAKAQVAERDGIGHIDRVKEDAILALPGYGISPQYKINKQRGFEQGAFTGELNPALAEGRVDRNPYTDKYTSHGDKIVGTSAENAAATRKAILSAIGDSEHGMALVGVSGRTAGGTSASLYGAADASSAADHALVAYLENGIIKIAELLNAGSTGTGKSITGKDVAVGAHPGADTFEDVFRTWDYAHAVPLNGATPEQAAKFKTQLEDNTATGTQYSLIQTLNDAGKLIGETCSTVIAKSGRDAGILHPDFGKSNIEGKNTLLPSDIIKVFEARNEEYRRGTATQPIADVGELDKTVQHLSNEFNDLDVEYKQLTRARRDLLLKLIASDENLRADLDDLATTGGIKSVESFVDNVASARYASKSKTVAGLDHKHISQTADMLGITDTFEAQGVGNEGLFNVEDRRSSTADLLEIQKAKLHSAQRAQQDRLLLKTSRPTTSGESVEKNAALLGTALGYLDPIKENIDSVKTTSKKYIEQFKTSIKDIFQRISATFSDLFSSVNNISFGDIASTVKQFFRKSITLEPKEAAPAFALTDVKATADKFSKNVYRPVAFGVSQFGAGLNAVREVASGAKQGGAGGALDIIGGIIKLLHTLANTNAFFGTKLLPKGVGEIFNQRRSETLLDIAEIGIGATTGHRRTPVDKTYRSLASQEKPLAEKVVDLRTQIETAATSGAGEGAMLALRQELAKNVEELRQLRSQINAYRIVLSREAEEEVHKQGGPSTGKALDPVATPSFALSKEDATKATYSKIKQFTGEHESLLSAQASDSLQRFSAGTGLSAGIGGGVAVVQQQNALEAAQQFFSKQAIGDVKNNQIQGLSIPVLDELGKRISSVILTTAGKNDRRPGVIVHEATHELVEQLTRKGTPIYTGTTRSDFALADPALEAKRSTRLDAINTSGQSNARADYLFDPREMFAHIGEALISGNNKLETELRKLYGDDLYNDVVRTLESTLPDTFAPQYLQGLQAKFATFNSELDEIFKQSTAPNVDLGQTFSKLMSSFNISPTATKSIQEKFENIVPTIGAVARNPDAVKRLTEAATPLLYNEDSFKGRTIGAVQRAGGNDLLKQAFATLQNPSIGNVDELLKGVKKSPELIKKALQAYISDALNIDESILAKLPKNSLGKIAGLVINQFTPDQANFRDTANTKIQTLTGRNLKEGTFQQSASVDAATGVEHFSLSAQTATGAMISLNGHIDEFGRKKLDEPQKQLNRFSSAIKEIGTGAFRQIGDSFTYGLVNSFQEMFRQLVGIQDELGEVANLLGVVGDKATVAKSKFLFQSVNVAVKTGQGFDEAIQTNLKNFKILGSVKDPNKREELANQVSEVQLGAQTAFGISLEQSLESIPAILATIRDGMDSINDPAEKVTASISELRDIMDQVVVAQRTTGAQGDELLTVYSRLAASAKDYGLNSKQLLGITATSSVAIGKGEDETSNILRSFLEGTYSSANQSSFAKNGIATQQFNTGTNQLENRSFEDVLKDLNKLSQDKSKAIDYNQLLQSIAGPKLAPDISKVVQGFGSNYADVEAQINNTPKGTAETLVAQKSQNFAGSLNKLEATGTQFLGSLLVGTGGFDSAAKLFDRLSESAIKLTSLLNDNEGSIKKIVSALAPLVQFFTIGFATKDLNIFSPLAKGIQAVETKFSSTISKLTDFGRVGESKSTQVQKVLSLIGVALEELDAGFLRTGSTGQTAFSKIAQSATVAGKAIQGDAAFALSTPRALINPYDTVATKSTLVNPYDASVTAATPTKTPLNDRLGIKALNTSGITQTDLAQLRGEEATSNFSLRGTADSVIATAGKQSKLTQLRQGLEKPGAAAGALVAPVAFDVLSGGLGNDNLVNVGVGIAGGIAGAFAGGPYGAIIGYSIGKAVSESIDIPGIVGTSEKEASTFADALAEKLFNKKPDDGTPTEKEQNRLVAVGQLSQVATQLGVPKLQATIAETGINSSIINASSAEVKDYLDRQATGRKSSFVEGFFQNDNKSQKAVDLFGGNKDLLSLFANSGLSSVQEFVQQLDEASKGTGPLAESFTKLSIVTQQQAAASADVAQQDVKRAQLVSAQELVQQGQQKQSDLEAKLQNDYQTPYGLDKYNAFSPLAQNLDKSFAPDINKINSGALTGQDAQGVLDRLSRSQESLSALPQTLQQLVPLAQSLGLNSKGLEQKLYNVGAQGQGQIVQKFQPAIEADRSVQGYELQRSRLQVLQRTDQFKAKDPAILAEVAALQKALATDKARYDINKAFLELLKGQSGALLDQTAQVEAQNKTRQLISAGTPAQFTPASIFDTKGTTAAQLNNAIDFALKKQSKLSALNPEYKKEFAKDQFLLQSGTDFKGVTGVNQGFVQEYLQQQQQQKEAPLQDLSQYSDEQIQKILGKARDLQGQAEKLDPARVGKYDNEHLLILKKNNDLLSQTGVGQEFLKAAIDSNTKSNDTLRGHYNLPSNYKSPTIFDYYDKGGKEKGDQNFPNGTGQGLVSLAFAQELANQLINKSNGDTSPNLSDINGTHQAGAAPLFYPTPGTAAVYSEVEPQILPDSIKTDQHISEAVNRFLEFKRLQIEDFDTATGPQVTSHAKFDQFKQHQVDIAGANSIAPRPTLAQVETQAAYSRLVDPNQPFFDTPHAGDVIKGTTTTLGTVTLPNTPYTKQPASSAVDSVGEARRDTRPLAGAEKTKTTLEQLAASTGKARDDVTTLGVVAAKTGTAINTISSTLPGIGVGAAALLTGATAFNGAVTALITKVAAFDLAQTLRNANVQIQVTVNGQAIAASATQVTINTSTVTGTNTLVGGSGSKTGSKLSTKF